MQVLRAGSRATLDGGEPVVVVAYSCGDPAAAIAGPDGRIRFVDAATLAPVAPPGGLLETEDLDRAGPLLHLILAGPPGGFQFRATWADAEAPSDFRWAELRTPALRCLAEHAERDPLAAGRALGRHRLLPLVALLAGRTGGEGGRPDAAQHALEERAAAWEHAVRLRDAGRNPTAATGAGGCLPSWAWRRVGGYSVPREAIWRATQAGVAKAETRAPLLELAEAHEELQRLYALRAALGLLPAIAGSGEVLRGGGNGNSSNGGGVGEGGSEEGEPMGATLCRLLHAAVLSNLAFIRVRRALAALMKAGGAAGRGLDLLRRIREGLAQSEPLPRREQRATQSLDVLQGFSEVSARPICHAGLRPLHE
jgi:hypothetical protein